MGERRAERGYFRQFQVPKQGLQYRERLQANYSEHITNQKEGPANLRASKLVLLNFKAVELGTQFLSGSLPGICRLGSSVVQSRGGRSRNSDCRR